MPDDDSQMFEEAEDAWTEHHAPARPARAQAADPVSRLLGLVVLVAIIMVLSAVAYVLYAGLLRPRAPRTAVERQVLVLEQYTKEDPTSAAAWADYVRALTLSEQYSQARRVLDQIEPLKTEEPGLLVEEGRLMIYTGEEDEALAILDQAIELAIAQRIEVFDELISRGITGMTTDPFAVWIVDAAILQTGVYQDREDWQRVVDTASVAIEWNSGMSDMFVVRGNAHVELGDEAAAEQDYRDALVFIPDYQEALDGLEAIGAQAGESDE